MKDIPFYVLDALVWLFALAVIIGIPVLIAMGIYRLIRGKPRND